MKRILREARHHHITEIMVVKQSAVKTSSDIYLYIRRTFHMKEDINNLYAPDYQELVQFPEYSRFGVFSSIPESDYLKDKNVLLKNEAIPPDHLTATYWG
jgi:hypothetical protein